MVFDTKKIGLGLALLVLLALNWWPTLDRSVESYLADAITDNLVIFATARSLNGIISVIQSIELSVSLGAGFGIHLGEILDPLNDLIERFSGFVLYGLAGLGLQKLVLVATSSLPMKVLLSVAMVLGYLALWVRPGFKKFIIRGFLLLLMVRFAFVVEVGLIAGLDRLYFDERTKQAHSALQLTRDTLSNLREEYVKAVSESGIYKGLLTASGTLLGGGEEDGIADIAASAIVELMVITLVRGLLLPLMFVWLLLLGFRRLLPTLPP